MHGTLAVLKINSTIAHHMNMRMSPFLFCLKTYVLEINIGFLLVISRWVIMRENFQ